MGEQNSQVQCPNCGSYKTNSQTVYLISGSLAIIGCLGCITMILFLPLVVVVVPIGLIIFLVAIIDRAYKAAKGRPVSYKCNNCGVWFEKT